MPPPNDSQVEQANVVNSRLQLAELLHTTTEFIVEVVANPTDWYTEFEVPKATGGVRIIQPPRKPLRAVQRSLLRFLYSRTSIPGYLHGGLPKRSIITHARGHVSRAMVATLDVKSFFPSTGPALIRPVLARAGFECEALSDALALTILDGGLPQGSPTSCLLANLAFLPVDSTIIRLCRTRRLSYTRYVDDIAVSGTVDFMELKGPLMDRIRAGGYDVSEQKVRFMADNERQIITGLVVNAKLRPTAEFVAHLKSDIRLCLRIGPKSFSDLEGVPARAIKSRLTGRVAHVAASDPKLGKRLRGMLCGITWSSRELLP